jgi:SRSO17 transposase
MIFDESREMAIFGRGDFFCHASRLVEVRPLRFEEVSLTPRRRQWDALVKRFHYLRYRRLPGQCLKYLIYSCRGELLAATGWHSSVWKLASRDQAIGWTVAERQRALGRIANNSRFVIFPWVKVVHLASHLLSRQVAHVREDWKRKYGQEVALLETFVDPTKFRGTCYRAANWICVGRTKGYGKTWQGFKYHGRIKEVYVYPLSSDLSEALGLMHRPEVAVNHQYHKTLAEAEQRRAQMAKVKAGWNMKGMPSFEMEPEDLPELVDAFGEYYLLFRDCFGRVENEELSRSYLQGLLSSLERKSVEPMALSLLGEKRVKALQRFMVLGSWEVEELGKRHRQEAARTISAPDGVWSVDGCDVPKKGTESVGVARQYCRRLGKVDNCQAGVFVGYASSKGHALVDRRLFLPERWFEQEYRERWVKCRIPEGTTFKTKPELALEMIQGLHQEGLFQARWVTGDDFFGRNPTFRDGLPKDLLYFLDIPSDTRVWKKRPEIVIPRPSKTGRRPKKPHLKRGEPDSILVSDLAKDASLSWHKVTVAEGAKGPIRAKVARVRVVLSEEGLPGKDLWLLIRRSLTDGEMKYAISNAPEDLPLQEMVRVSGLRWPIEQCFQEGKSEIGMDHYEHRSWDAWHRHMTFVFLAQLFLLRIRQRLKKKSSPDLAAGGAAHQGGVPDARVQEELRAGGLAVLSEAELDRVPLTSESETGGEKVTL